jgi:hypothetical protein
MTEVLLQTFRKEVQPYAPEAPELVVDNAVRNACIEFCNKTHWVTYQHAPITLVTDQATYDYTLPDDNEIARIITACVGSRQLSAFSESGLRDSGNWRTLTAAIPLGYLSDDLHEILLVPYPNEDVGDDTLQITMALRPTRTAAAVASDLYDIWGEAIAYGARARLHELPGQSYSDLNLAAMCHSKFKQGIGQATHERNRGLTTSPQYVRPPRFI